MTGESIRGGIVVGFALFAWVMIWAATAGDYDRQPNRTSHQYSDSRAR